MLNLSYCSRYHGETKIALLDNSAISFLQQLDDRGYKPEYLLQGYDVVFLPGWVAEELEDSESRSGYIERLAQEGAPIQVIEESFYSGLMDGEEIFLYDIVKASVSKLGVLLKYIRMHVEKEDMLDMEPYEDWIKDMYTNWPFSESLTAGGRVKKKNAGEISLTILAEIFSWYYPNTEVLTIFTQDADTYVFQKHAEEQLRKKKNLKNVIPINVTYRSNDSLLCQMYRDRRLAVEEMENIRKDFRYMTYTLTRKDKTVALETKRIDNEEFVKLIQDESVQIIF